MIIQEEQAAFILLCSNFLKVCPVSQRCWFESRPAFMWLFRVTQQLRPARKSDLSIMTQLFLAGVFLGLLFLASLQDSEKKNSFFFYVRHVCYILGFVKVTL